MQNLRITLGVSLFASLAIIIGLGFFATSSRDLVLVFAGFASALVVVYAIEHLKIERMRKVR